MTLQGETSTSYNADHQYQFLVMAVEHEEEVARASNNAHWWAIFKGTDGRRTITALWTLMTQQFIGLTLFSTFASYFFQQAGNEDPFQATCITSGLNIAANLTMILTADRFWKEEYFVRRVNLELGCLCCYRNIGSGATGESYGIIVGHFCVFVE